MPIVLLHGLFDDHRGWRDLPRRLAAAGHAVIAVDLPGHGDSAPGADVLDDAARDIADALAAAVPNGPMRVVGHSLGAALAVRIAGLLPGRVDRLILCAPVGLGARISPDFTEGMLAAETPAALARALALLDAGPMSPTVLQQELARLMPLRSAHRAWTAGLARRGFQQIDITGDLARLGCDLRVLFGTADRILDWNDIANLPTSAAIHLVRGAGHLPHHADPDLLVALAGDEGRSGDRKTSGH